MTVSGKGMFPDTKRDVSFWVRNFESPPDEAPPIKMEVGIEDCLHIEFEYDKAKYHLKVRGRRAEGQAQEGGQGGRDWVHVTLVMSTGETATIRLPDLPEHSKKRVLAPGHVRVVLPDPDNL